MFRIKPSRLLIEPCAAVVSDSDSTATLHIDGLVCSACAINVQRRLEHLHGVRQARVDLETQEAIVSYQHPVRDGADLVRAIEGAVWFPTFRRLVYRLAISR